MKSPIWCPCYSIRPLPLGGKCSVPPFALERALDWQPLCSLRDDLMLLFTGTPPQQSSRGVPAAGPRGRAAVLTGP